MSEPLTDKPQNVARHVATDVSDVRLGRMWSRIEPRLPGPKLGPSFARRAGFAAALVGCLALGIAGAAAYRSHGSAPSPLEGAWLETRADTLSIRLVDGSSLRLEASTQLRVARDASSAVQVVLQRGRIECDVVHQDGRSFVVLADGIEVRVVGTHFSVSLDPRPDAHRVDVSVERGVVEVRSEAGAVSRVAAGQRFSQLTSLNGTSVPAPSLAASPPLAPPADSAAPAMDASASPEPDGSGAPASERPKDPALGAKELLEHAGTLRRDGRVREAADQYELLLTRFPSDPRAGLAAFELGRLRMDRLGDLVGAVRALELAARAAPGAGFREDAMGRLANAYAARGDQTSCARVRDRYLREYPNGIHRTALEHRCSP